MSGNEGLFFFLHCFLSNFEMAVSYGATFPVLVLLLSIGFTGYLEVNKPQLHSNDA